MPEPRPHPRNRNNEINHTYTRHSGGVINTITGEMLHDNYARHFRSSITEINARETKKITERTEGRAN